MNQRSHDKLNTCHPDISRLALEVDNEFPIQCICGKRNELDQNKAYENGMSKLKYPNSKHNKEPLSWAGDFVPDPDRNPKTIDWDDIKSFKEMCKVFEKVAKRLKIKIRLGRDFKFKDFPHIELA